MSDETTKDRRITGLEKVHFKKTTEPEILYTLCTFGQIFLGFKGENQNPLSN